MPLYSFEGKSPSVAEDAFIAPNATLVGEVRVESGASVWYGAVIRADFSPVIIREGANVQDLAMIHGPPNMVTEIGPGATVAHLCVVHGATIGEEALVANGCTVLDGAKIGARSMIAAHSLVPAGADIPEGVLAAGIPAEVKRELAGSQAEFWVKMNPSAYRRLAARHAEGVEPTETV